MLMDEPFGAVDPINRERLQNEFLRLQAELRKTILFVTHDIDEAIKMGDRIAILHEAGHLAQYATPAELLMAPADDFVEDFVGADRALKRLALLRVSDIDLWEAPLAHVGQATAEVRAKLAGAEVPHALLVDAERRPLGWLSNADLARETVPARARHLARPDPRSRRRDARCAVRSAPGRDALRARRRRARADRRGALGRDHLRVPDVRRGADGRAPGGGASAGHRGLMLAEFAIPLAQSGDGFVREAGQGATSCVGRNDGDLLRLRLRPPRDYVTPPSSTSRSFSPRWRSGS